MSQEKFSLEVNVFSERLREASQGVNQAGLAQSLGIGQSSVSMYLRGDRIPSLEVFHKMCNTLGVSADWLLGLSDVRTASASSGDGGIVDKWRRKADAAERKLDKVNEALGKIIEGTKALQEAVK